MLKFSILLLLCLSSVYSGTVEKDPVVKEPETEADKSKRHAPHPEPCPPEHHNSQIWKPEIKQAISYVKPVSTGWQPKSSGWDQQKWQPPTSGWQPKSSGWEQKKWQPATSGWQPKSSGWEQQKWQPMSSGWQQPKWQPMLTGWQQPKWQPMSSGWQPKSSGWEQQKWQPATTGWQPKSSGWQPKSSGWEQQKWQPASSGWQPKSSGWQQPKWQPMSSGWQTHSSGWQQSKVDIHKPMFSYAPMYHQPMVHQSWTPSVKSPCPDPCKPTHGAHHYAPLPPMHHIKIPQINYIKPQIHPPVHIPPVQNKVWEEPCD